MQLREVLDDLRLGRLTLRMTDTLATHNLDRVGRRIFSAVVAGSLFASGAYLLGTGHDTHGWVFITLAGVVCVMHWLRDAMSKPKA